MAINLDLAMMALEGLTKEPMSVAVGDGEILVEASSKGLRELARLLLLAGGDDTEPGEEITLEPGLHVVAGSPRLRVRRVEDPERGVN
jgi:hypothetical protein